MKYLGKNRQDAIVNISKYETVVISDNLCSVLFKHNFVSSHWLDTKLCLKSTEHKLSWSHMYPENPEGTHVIVITTITTIITITTT